MTTFLNSIKAREVQVIYEVNLSHWFSQIQV